MSEEAKPCAGCGEPPLLVKSFGYVYMCSLYAARDPRSTYVCGYVSRYLKRCRGERASYRAWSDWNHLQRMMTQEGTVLEAQSKKVWVS